MLQIWQVLPLVPPEEFAWSPYSGLDALCGNVLLISLDGLAQDGLLSRQDLPKAQPVSNADFPTVCRCIILGEWVTRSYWVFPDAASDCIWSMRDACLP